MPPNITQFIRSEIKNSPVLSGREPVFDYSRIPAIANGPERVFVAGTDSEKIEALFKTLKSAGIDPVSIEVSTVASLRAIHSSLIAGAYESNLLIAILNGSMLTICVFRKSELDFLRSIAIGEDAFESGRLIERCRREIEAVIQ